MINMYEMEKRVSELEERVTELENDVDNFINILFIHTNAIDKLIDDVINLKEKEKKNNATDKRTVCECYAGRRRNHHHENNGGTVSGNGKAHS